MCTIKEGFKLCTCGGGELKKADVDWILQRKNPALPLRHRRGRVARPRFSPEEEMKKEMIQQELNDRNCFDFDYTPQEDDRLTFKKYAFRYAGGKWMIDGSTSLSPWRSQLEQFEKGKID